MVDCSETLNNLLNHLNRSSSDIQASAIVSSEGLLMAAVMGESLDPDRIAAMTNAMVAQAKRALHQLNCGRLRLILLKGNDGYVLMHQAGEQAILTVLLRQTAQLGFIFLCCQRYAVKISATGIAKPNTRIGLIYVGKSKPKTA